VATYNVYFGDTSGDLSLIVKGSESAEFAALILLTAVGLADYNTSYYWRVDTVNQFGITAGDEWTFTSISFCPPLPFGMTLDDEGNPTGNPTGENNVMIIKRLIAAAKNAVYYESI